MATYFAAFLLSYLVGVVATSVVRDQARARGLFDCVNSSRKVHRTPIPRLGGVAIVLGFSVAPAFLFLMEPGASEAIGSQTPFLVALLAGGAAIVAVGLYDDLRGANARLKLAVQVGVALLMYWLGVRVEVIANPFGPPLVLGYLSLPFTVLWVVGIINALNLIDGLDGLAGGVALFALVTNFVLALAQGNVLLCLLMAGLGGAVVAFLCFNFNPASIFMGDTGSMFLGMMLAALSIETASTSGSEVAMLIPIFALGLPIMDTLVAMVRRALVGRPMFSADKEHIHHRMMSRMQLSHRATVLSLYGLCLLFTLTALGLFFAETVLGALLMVATFTACLALLRALGYLSYREVSTFGEVRRRNQSLRAVVRSVSRNIREAQSLPEVSDSMRPLVEALNAQRLILEVAGSVGAQRDLLRFEIERGGGGNLPVATRMALTLGSEPLGQMVLFWRDRSHEIDRDEELAIEQAALVTAEAVSRLRSTLPGPSEDVEEPRRRVHRF